MGAEETEENACVFLGFFVPYISDMIKPWKRSLPYSLHRAPTYDSLYLMQGHRWYLEKELLLQNNLWTPLCGGTLLREQQMSDRRNYYVHYV